MTDDEGFNPYTDSVGPGIYGGRVMRNEEGEIIIGKQYQVCLFVILDTFYDCIIPSYLFPKIVAHYRHRPI